MNKSFRMALTVAAAFVTSVAVAAPVAYYNPGNGSIYISNDTGAPLAHATIISTSGKLAEASSMLILPGTIKDDSEFPFAYTYLPFPVGVHHTGYTVQPGTSVLDLQFVYRTTSLLNPLIQGSIIHPEPSSCLLVTMAILAYTAASRPARRRSNSINDLRLSSTGALS